MAWVARSSLFVWARARAVSVSLRSAWAVKTKQLKRERLADNPGQIGIRCERERADDYQRLKCDPAQRLARRGHDRNLPRDDDEEGRHHCP